MCGPRGGRHEQARHRRPRRRDRCPALGAARSRQPQRGARTPISALSPSSSRSRRRHQGSEWQRRVVGSGARWLIRGCDDPDDQAPGDGGRPRSGRGRARRPGRRRDRQRRGTTAPELIEARRANQVRLPAMDHPSLSRPVQIFATSHDQVPRRGSGYVVAPGLVLTAAHVVEGATSIQMWIGAPLELDPRRSDRRERSATLSPSRPPTSDDPTCACCRFRAPGSNDALRSPRSRRCRARPSRLGGLPRFKLRNAGGTRNGSTGQVHFAVATSSWVERGRAARVPGLPTNPG